MISVTAAASAGAYFLRGEKTLPEPLNASVSTAALERARGGA
ncbi:hypothetical protein [Paraburkholderia bengalensis]